jgi:anti-sigma factor RsiW
MMHSQVNRLLDAFLDDTLTPAERDDVERHVASCPRCSANLAHARRTLRLLRAAPPVGVPQGFARRVMDGVYAQALRGAGSEETRAMETTKVYRRLGYSFMVTAGVLALTLAVPRLAYPRLVDPAGVQTGGEMIVKGLMDGAAHSVRGALGENEGGMTK